MRVVLPEARVRLLLTVSVPTDVPGDPQPIESQVVL